MGSIDVDYLEFAKDVVARAVERGVEAEAYISVGQNTSVNVDRGEVEKLSQAGSKGLGVRVIRDGKMGYAYTSDFGAGSVGKTIEAAVSLADVADGDEYRSLPAPQPLLEEDLDIYDQAVVELPIGRKVEMARRIEKAALRYDERVVLTNRCTLISQHGTVAIANSKEVAGSYDKSFIGGFVMAMAADENDRSVAFGFDFGSRLADFKPTAIGKDAARKAVGMLGGRPVPTQRASVVYSPMAATSVLGALSRALGADAMQRNRSFLEGKIGETVAADTVTVLDNGRLPGGIATRPFDDEGVPTAATRLIDEGVLQTALHDHYTATRDGTASSTGNATRRGHASMPTLDASNFYFQPGQETPEEVIGGVEQGLYVESVMNTASINPISGDYSISAKGYWIENGALSHPVNEVTIALPMQELLHNVKAVGNDLTFVPMMGALGSPTIRVDGVMIGGSS